MARVRELPPLYHELADWWPVLSPPEEYEQDAAAYERLLLTSGTARPMTLLELGSGGGNNASHLKSRFQMTLVDLSPAMLDVSRKLNPECEHIQGDMRTVRLERLFDAVFIHDAIVYMTSEEDLRQALQTAFLHCRPGGIALFVPDHTRETLQVGTIHVSHIRGDRQAEYTELTWDPDPNDTTYVCIMVYRLRKDRGKSRHFEERHLCGLFPQEQWLRILSEVGFSARTEEIEDSRLARGSYPVFVALRPAGR